MSAVRKHIVCPDCGAINAAAPDRDPMTAKCDARAVPLFSGKRADVDAAHFERQTKRGIPALLLLHRGRLVAQSAGVMDTQRIVAWTRAALASSQETTHDR